MLVRLVQALLLAAVVVALAWLVADPGFEPLVTAIMGLVGFLSLRRAIAEPDPPLRISAARTRIAILPLQNITEIEGKEYFAEGLTEELISVLSRIRGLQVIARSSVTQYRDGRRPIAEIGRELNVGAVLEGSVRSAGEELRVTVRLVDVVTESHLWAADYDRELKDIFAVQRDIAREVARSLKVSVLGAEAARVEQTPTTDFEAYDLYLLGRHDLNQRTEEGVRRSIDRFRAAVEKDPTFAAAHAGIADAYVLATIGYASIALPVAMREARAASTRALEAQDDLSDVHTSRGYLMLNFDWDWNGAALEFQRALELNPSDARAYQWFAQCYTYQGRFEEAIPLSHKAQELDPRSALIATEAGWPYLYSGRNEEALVQFNRAIELDPNFPLAHLNVGNILETERDFEGAFVKYALAADLSGRAPMFVAFEARALALLGRREEAETALRDVIESADAGSPCAVYVAHVYEALGEMEEAVAWLERAVARDERMILAINTRWLPFEALRGVPRYEKIVSGLPIGLRGG